MPFASMSPSPPDDPRRRLPPVDRLLADPRVAALQRVYGRELVRVQLRSALARLRAHGAGAVPPGSPAELEAELERLPGELAAELARALGHPLRRVLNATGVFLHTNLGRAPLPPEVAAELAELSTAACDLEIELGAGTRGDRGVRLSGLLTALTGAEAAVVVNNNAAALVLAVAALAHGREVMVSRGELVEIGGSFRIPEILAAAGARLVEVGTTNRTRLADYERALAAPGATALLLKVLPSNFRMSGFTAEVDAAALAAPRRAVGRAAPGRRRERFAPAERATRARRAPEPARAPRRRAPTSSAAAATSSLGGPQAGLLAGRAALVEVCRRHPLYRALRPGRLATAALERVLRLHLAGAELPLDRLWPEPAAHRARCRRVAEAIGAEIVAADAFLGGGSAPDEPIPGEALALPARAGLARAAARGRAAGRRLRARRAPGARPAHGRPGGRRGARGRRLPCRPGASAPAARTPEARRGADPGRRGPRVAAADARARARGRRARRRHGRRPAGGARAARRGRAARPRAHRPEAARRVPASRCSPSRGGCGRRLRWW